MLTHDFYSNLFMSVLRDFTVALRTVWNTSGYIDAGIIVATNYFIKWTPRVCEVPLYSIRTIDMIGRDPSRPSQTALTLLASL